MLNLFIAIIMDKFSEQQEVTRQRNLAHYTRCVYVNFGLSSSRVVAGRI